MSDGKTPRDVIHLSGKGGKVDSGKPTSQSQASASSQTASTTASAQTDRFWDW
jgi:hypothetical protein